MSSLTVMSPMGARASPYRVEGHTLVKRVQERHIFRLRQAIGVDESIWQRYSSQIELVRFIFPDRSVREISASSFACKSFLHGGDGRFALTRFIAIAELVVVKDGMKSLF